MTKRTKTLLILLVLLLVPAGVIIGPILYKKIKTDEEPEETGDETIEVSELLDNVAVTDEDTELLGLA